jgi:hypothetical protein
MAYTMITDFGPEMISDPTPMCVGTNISQSFNYGPGFGQKSSKCQIFMAQRCSASNWDDACEMSSKQHDSGLIVAAYGDGTSSSRNMSDGDLFLRNTAMEKYRVSIMTDPSGTQQCELKIEQFNPLDTTSPKMFHYTGDCVGDYAIRDITNLDNDPVMNRILQKPEIFDSLLSNIYMTMLQRGDLQKLKGTKLGTLFKL